MAPAVVVDPNHVHEFADAMAFERWLAKHHHKETEVWIKVHKKASGLRSITTAEALDVVLCWGWIDGIRKGLDERSFLQRYTPRRKKSIWSQINREHVARLIAAGRMTEHGEREIAAAKADGRWDAAYAPIGRTTADTLPDDLRAAIERNVRAKKTLATLTKQNLFALSFRVNSMKTAAGRATKIATLVEMLARGEAPSPSSSTRAASPTPPRSPPLRRATQRRGPRARRRRGA